jgi:hypothetical protein
MIHLESTQIAGSPAEVDAMLQSAQLSLARLARHTLACSRRVRTASAWRLVCR